MAGLKSLRLILLSVLLWPGTAYVNASNYSFNLYLSVGPIKLPAGNARLYDTKVTFNGKDAIRSAMEMTTSPAADKLFELRDSLESYSTTDGESLYYRKTINEGKMHLIETARFSKEKNRFIANLTTYNVLTGETINTTEWRPTRIFDAISMLNYTQKIDTKGILPGRTEELPMVNGEQVVQQYLIYTGNKKVKADNGRYYECLVVSIRDYKHGKERETVRAYVTNDSHHTPVQLDIFLTTGVAIRALLK